MIYSIIKPNWKKTLKKIQIKTPLKHVTKRFCTASAGGIASIVANKLCLFFSFSTCSPGAVQLKLREIERGTFSVSRNLFGIWTKQQKIDWRNCRICFNLGWRLWRGMSYIEVIRNTQYQNISKLHRIYKNTRRTSWWLCVLHVDQGSINIDKNFCWYDSGNREAQWMNEWMQDLKVWVEACTV